MHSLMDALFGHAFVARSTPSFLTRLNAAMALHRSRASLSRLDQHLLDDIGIDQARAEVEAARPLWDAPANWRR